MSEVWVSRLADAGKYVSGIVICFFVLKKTLKEINNGLCKR